MLGKAVADLQTAERLFLLGAEVNYVDEDGWSALFHAAGEGHIKVVEWLVDECHADINLQSPEQITPIWIASFNGRRNVVQVVNSVTYLFYSAVSIPYHHKNI
jgi:ankyrin repeat protein